ncbi:MAG TPA: hypothetical protein VJ385_07510 [Fibrobacteria bacterium]|nr:hypothetical protein [Fibrobacteria bacterium]
MKQLTMATLLCAFGTAATAVPASEGNRMDAGEDHLLFLREDGSLWGAGADRFGQLGRIVAARNPEAGVSPLPQEIGPEAWTRVSAGVNYSLAIRADGSLWVFGRNGSAQAGVERCESVSAPMPMDANRWLDVAAGDAVSLGIAADGSLNMWGEWKKLLSNAGRQGGRKGRPRQVAEGAWKAVEMGADHAFALREDGTLWAMGENASGQTGCQASAAARTLCQVAAAEDAEDEAGAAAPAWKSVSAGESFSVGIRADGSLWTWGANAMGELGRGAFSEREAMGRVGNEEWLSVSAGGHHVLAIRSDGTLWAWGAGAHGALGTGSSGNSALPMQVGYEKWTAAAAGKRFSAALRADGEFLIWGNLGFMQGPGTGNKNPIAAHPGYLDRKLTVNPIGPVILGGRDPVIGFVANHWDSVSVTSGNPSLLQPVGDGFHPLAAGRTTVTVKAFPCACSGSGQDTLSQVRTVTVAKARQAPQAAPPQSPEVSVR